MVEPEEGVLAGREYRLLGCTKIGVSRKYIVRVEDKDV